MKINQRLFWALVPLLALLCFRQSAFAEEPIDTDGPDFVDSSEAIGKNRFQYEAEALVRGTQLQTVD